MYSGTEFVVSSLPVKWLVCLLKQFIVLLSVTCVGCILHNLFFTTLCLGLRLIAIFPDIMHTEQIMQHCLHIATHILCVCTCICGQSSQIRSFNWISYKLLAVINPVFILEPHSFPLCQVVVYQSQRVSPIKATCFTRTMNESIRSLTIFNCKVYKWSTTVYVFIGGPRLRHPTLVHSITTYIQKKKKLI